MIAMGSYKKVVRGPATILTDEQRDLEAVASVDFSDSTGASLVFVSNRKLIGESLFFRAAQQLGLSYSILDPGQVILGEALVYGYCPGSIVVVDFSAVQDIEVEDLSFLVNKADCVIGFVDRASYDLCSRLSELGFVSIIDMGVNEGAIPLILKLSISGQTFVPRVRDAVTDLPAKLRENAETIQEILSISLPEMGMKPPSRAEMGVVFELLQGMSNKEIAARIGKSVATVKMHVLRMSRRYGVTNRVQLVLFMKEILRSNIRGHGGRVA